MQVRPSAQCRPVYVDGRASERTATARSFCPQRVWERTRAAISCGGGSWSACGAFCDRVSADPCPFSSCPHTTPIECIRRTYAGGARGWNAWAPENRHQQGPTPRGEAPAADCSAADSSSAGARQARAVACRGGFTEILCRDSMLPGRVFTHWAARFRAIAGNLPAAWPAAAPPKSLRRLPLAGAGKFLPARPLSNGAALAGDQLHFAANRLARRAVPVR